MGKENRKKKNRISDARIEIKASITFITILLLVGGIFLFLISYLINTTQGEVDIPALSALRDVVKNIGLTMFSAGLVSVLVEVSTITSVVQKAVDKIVTGEFPFDKFSVERLSELGKQIAAKRSAKENMTVSKLNKTIYALEPKLLENSVGIFYEYHKDTTIITPDESEQLFRKWVDLEYKLINRFKVPHTIKFSISLITNSEKITDKEIEQYFKVEAFNISFSSEVEGNDRKLEKKSLVLNKDYSIKIESIEKKPHSTYKYRIKIEYLLDNIATCIVKMTCSYAVPMSDPIQSFKLNHPSKEFEHSIMIKDNNWEIMADAYTAFYFTGENKEYQVEQKLPNTVKVVFKNWAVPGAGYMALLCKTGNNTA